MTADFLKEYLPIILFLIIALGLSCAFIILNFILSPKNPILKNYLHMNVDLNRFQDSRMEFDVRFYLVAILFIIFDLEMHFFSMGNIFRKYRFTWFYINDDFFIHTYCWIYI